MKKFNFLHKSLVVILFALLVAVFVAPTVFAVAPPATTTDMATNSGYTGATLNGSVSGANGAVISQRGFQYGTDTSYGQSTTENVADPNIYNYTTQWGRNPLESGQFNEPRGITTDAAGSVYVADTNNHRIQKFDANGTYITQWGSYGSGDGQFNTPQGITTDVTGNVFVADNNNRIQKFDANGTYITKWGVVALAMAS